MSEYSVSLPDLRGVEKQVGNCGDTYRELYDAFEPEVFTHNDDDVLAVIHSLSQDSPLASGLSLFSKQVMAYIEATHAVCRRLAKGFDKTAERLGDTVDEYKELEDEALEELDAAEPDSAEAKDARKTADSIDHGDANSDWTAKVTADDHLPGAYSSFDYRTRSSSYYDELTDLERIGEQFVDMSVAGTVDAVLEWFIGYSPTTQFCTPLIVGDWGYLWYLRDYFNGAADAVDEIRELLDKGTDTLLAGDWTGDAAENYEHHADKGWGDVLERHSDNMREAAKLFHSVGDAIEETGATISPILTMLFDIVIDLISRNPSKILAALKDVPSTLAEGIIGLVAEGELKIEDLIDFLTAAGASTEDLVNEAEKIEAPHFKQAND